MGKRAYVNPVPGFGEKEQRAIIDAAYGDIAEWYVESRSVTRADFISHLRAGDEAVVACVGCLAKPIGDWRAKDADLKDARGDINGQGAVLVAAHEKLRSDKDWPAMKVAAKAFFLWTKNIGNASARRLNYTDREIRELLIVRANKNLGSWKARRAAIVAKGIKPPGRTYFIQWLPIEAAKRGISI